MTVVVGSTKAIETEGYKDVAAADDGYAYASRQPKRHMQEASG